MKTRWVNIGNRSAVLPPALEKVNPSMLHVNQGAYNETVRGDTGKSAASQSADFTVWTQLASSDGCEVRR